MKHSIWLDAEEYRILTRNFLISMVCAKQLQTAVEYDDGFELLLSAKELDDLTGYVAAEANHARSAKQSRILNEICDRMEGAISDIRRQARSEPDSED